MPYAVFSIQVEGGIVIDAAPIGKWMVGKDTAFIRKWITNKNGYYETLF